MSLVEKSHTSENYYITLEVTRKNDREIYVVQVCPLMEENVCGYPVAECVYPITEKAKAIRTFNRYKRKYIQKEENKKSILLDNSTIIIRMFEKEVLC